jgi:membrane fusion protein, heavy metal efflux system
MVIRAEVQQRHSHLLGSIHSVNIIAPGGQVQSLGEIGGTVLSMAQNVSERNHLFTVHLQAEPVKASCRVHLLDVYLKTLGGDPVIVVPNGSLIEEQGNYFVYVQVHPERFVKRQVHPAGSDGYGTGIISGLSEGERIVTRGAILVKAASAAGNLDPHSGSCTLAFQPLQRSCAVGGRTARKPVNGIRVTRPV